MSEHAPHGGSHMHDFEAHVRAVEEDLEYYRAKRIEPRVFTLLRRGIIAFGDLFAAAASNADGPTVEGEADRPAPFPSPEILQNGPRRQGSASPRKTSAALTAPGRSTNTVP